MVETLAQWEESISGQRVETDSHAESVNHLHSSYIATPSADPGYVPEPQLTAGCQESTGSGHRGLLGHLVIFKPVEEPMNYNRNIKWLITLLVSGTAAIDPICSTILYRMRL